MKTSPLVFAAGAFLLLMTAPVFAQGGCINSPENPTAVLAAVGSAGCFFFARRGKRQ